MRILLVSHKFPPHSLGGVEVYTRNLAHALRARHRVAVFYRHDEAEGPPFAEYDDQAENLWLRRVACRPGGWRASVAGQFFDTFVNRRIEAGFARFVARFQPDLIHIQHVMALSARLLPLARRSAPTLLTLHDYWFLCGNSQLIWPDGQVCQGKAGGMNCVRCAAAARFPLLAGGGVGRRLLQAGVAPLFVYRDRVVRRAALQADHFIAPSRFLRDRYLAAGFPADRFTYLENGIVAGRIGRATPRRSADEPLRVTFLGSLAWQKGVHILAEAFSALPPGAARLRIWGDPTVFPDYADRLRRLLAGREDARLMGRIANERVGEALSDSDVIVVPSLWYENSPVVIQEARAAGLPVVASDRGALAEKVRPGVDGLLFPPGDVDALRRTLQRLIEEPELLARLRANVPPPLDMAGHAAQIEALYRRAAYSAQKASTVRQEGGRPSA
ncbi:MAG TPA: glycosyltransferase [Anaerolineae bacterium]|nr:glycosyltransferase [Anaerolineae bacterium]